MIPLVTETAAAALLESNSSAASPRLTVVSVDGQGEAKFADHLRRIKSTRQEKPTASYGRKTSPPQDKRASEEQLDKLASRPDRTRVASLEDDQASHAEQIDAAPDTDSRTPLVKENAISEDVDADEGALLTSDAAAQVVTLLDGVSAAAELPPASADPTTEEVIAIVEINAIVVREDIPAAAGIPSSGGESPSIEPVVGDRSPVPSEPVRPASPELAAAQTDTTAPGKLDGDHGAGQGGTESGHLAGVAGYPTGEPIAPAGIADPPGENRNQTDALPTAATATLTSNAVQNVAAEVSLTESMPPAKPATREGKNRGPGNAFAVLNFGEASSTPKITSAASSPATTLATEIVEGTAEEREAGQRGATEELGQVELKRDSSVQPILSPSDAAQSAANTLPPALRRHMDAHSANGPRAAGSPPLTDTQQARLLQRVTRAFRAAEERGGEVQIRLSPPELGSMKLELSLSGGVLTAKIEVETQRAQSVLLDNLGTLKERLAEQGIRIEKFDVGLEQRHSGGDQPQQQSSQSERHLRSSSRPQRIEPELPSNENRTAAPASIDAARLNVII
jgi:flagellar hook-length control protein FliK